MSLLYKPLESIGIDDVQGLIDNQVGESRYIEYKAEVFDKRDEKKRLQFLGSVTAFANSAGGDILVGVRAVDGLPIDLPGLDPHEIDSETLRIRQVVSTSVEPQVSVNFHAVALPTGRSILILRIPRSWVGPHGIEQNEHFHFFKRHAAGRSPMTLSELRTAFTFSGSIVEQTRKFHSERLRALTTAGGPRNYIVPFTVLHVVPFASAAETVNIDVSKVGNLRCLSPLPADEGGFIRQGEVRYNLDGVMMHGDKHWHTQLFRNGAIEYANTEFFQHRNGSRLLEAWSYQVDVVRTIGRFSAFLRALGITPPVTLLFAIANPFGWHLGVSELGAMLGGTATSAHQFDPHPVLILPDVVLNEFSADPVAMLKPVFDCLWNAAGERKCTFYNRDGKWNLDPSWLDPPNVF